MLNRDCDQYNMYIVMISISGKEKAIVVAHDWGGIVAWNFVLRYPEMVEKFVILNAPHPKAFRKLISASVTQFLKAW